MNERFQSTGTSSRTSPGVEARRTMRRFHLKKKVGIAIASLTAFLLAPATSASAPAAADEQHVGPSAPAAVAEANDRRAHAAVVNPEPFEVMQPDGTRVTVVAWGDAQTHGYMTPSGHAVARDASGVWRYAVQLDKSGAPLPSCPRGREGCSTSPPRGCCATSLRRRRRRPGPMTPAARARGSGKQPALVILVSFTDRAPVGSTESNWADHFFGAGKSVATYYRQNSFNAFRLVPAAETSGAKPQRRRGVARAAVRPSGLQGRHRLQPRDQAASSRPQGGGSLRELSVLRHGPRRRAQLCRSSRHDRCRGLRHGVQRRGQRVWSERVGAPGRPSRRRADTRRHHRQPGRRDHAGGVVLLRQRPSRTHGDAGERPFSSSGTTSVCRRCGTPTLQLGHRRVEHDGRRRLEQGRRRSTSAPHQPGWTPSRSPTRDGSRPRRSSAR